ncbi:MAG TPA: bifunctional 4-hydroxy-2-oxoglutarate aldolase/2-dehydro-3-deoxy-phosphogluconate aldolase [Gemmatimonadaceae bacterium]|nr:bifunctional 4-hydroxy-2-oxoglutarate aldolase/2-dehydro-3-deoxy-phosphogluconate aldolase [Gemmatimonadaceae bacterium]
MTESSTAAPASSASATDRERTVREIAAIGAVAVIRMQDPRAAVRTVDALHMGGISAVEVTMTIPGALGVIEELARRADEGLLVGVGSVLDTETARRAVEAGARYVVSPVFKEAVVAEAHRLGVAAMPGAFTPTEILTAHEAGADVVKVFPSEALGPAFFKGVLAPMPFLKLMPTGGVTPENAGEWIRAGAVAVGVGSALMDPKLIAAGDFGALTERARRLALSVVEARQAMGAR